MPSSDLLYGRYIFPRSLNNRDIYSCEKEAHRGNNEYTPEYLEKKKKEETGNESSKVREERVYLETCERKRGKKGHDDMIKSKNSQ